MRNLYRLVFYRIRWLLRIIRLMLVFFGVFMFFCLLIVYLVWGFFLAFIVENSNFMKFYIW